MKIGFAYDSKDRYIAEGMPPLDAAEFDGMETINGIADSLTRLGHDVDRIGRLDDVVGRLAAGDRWDLVFNIAEGWRGPTRESQIPALLEAYGIPVTFGDSLCLAVCLHKGYSKRLVAAGGVPTARFAVVDDPDADLTGLGLAYPVFAKPVAEGTGKGVTAAGKAGDAEALGKICAALLDTFRQPVIVEEFLPGREFTVGVVGTGREARVLGVMEVQLLGNAEPEVYSYDNKDKYEDRVRYHLATGGGAVARAADIALRSYRLLGCRDAGRVDVRCDAAGRAQFLEINPLAGLNPVHSDLPILCRLQGMDYDALIAQIVASAAKRVPNAR